uniref:Dynein light chain Tctex-type 3 n=1 Tax=Esox lucius TaxID=8010 RepID=A0AAY5KHL5_ESOLU
MRLLMHSYPSLDMTLNTELYTSSPMLLPAGASLHSAVCVCVSLPLSLSLSVLQCIQSVIGEESYRQDSVNQWTAKIVEQALTLLVKQSKSFKYIVSCAVMQKCGAGLHTANSCYWDTAADGSCTVKWENRTMYCVVSVFAVALIS